MKRLLCILFPSLLVACHTPNPQPAIAVTEQMAKDFNAVYTAAEILGQKLEPEARARFLPHIAGLRASYVASTEALVSYLAAVGDFSVEDTLLIVETVADKVLEATDDQ